jgi:hypothetical protein
MWRKTPAQRRAGRLSGRFWSSRSDGVLQVPRILAWRAKLALAFFAIRFKLAMRGD